MESLKMSISVLDCLNPTEDDCAAVDSTEDAYDLSKIKEVELVGASPLCSFKKFEYEPALKTPFATPVQKTVMYRGDYPHSPRVKPKKVQQPQLADQGINMLLLAVKELCAGKAHKVWVSKNLPLHFGLFAITSPPAESVAEAFVLCHGEAPFVVFVVDNDVNMKDAENHYVNSCRILRNSLLMYCHVEFLVARLTIRRDACTCENLKNLLCAETKKLAFYYRLPFEVDNYLLKVLGRSTEALIRSTFVPSLLAALPLRSAWALILPEGWRTRLFQLIERVQRTGKHSVVVETGRETKSVEVFLALEVASRMSCSKSVVLESNSMLVERYVQRVTELAKDKHRVCLKLTYVPLEGSTPVKVIVKTEQWRA